MTRKICVVTGSRADYGLLHSVMKGISLESELELQVIVTGMHLSEEFGSTVTEIEADGFKIHCKVETLANSDTPEGIAKSIASGIEGSAIAFAEMKPDLVVLLGDRYEIFAAASAALVSRLPIAHLHGGEVTVGAFDEAFRHAITKMSQLHFVAHEDYRNRVIQLGENPTHVFNVGALGLSNYKPEELLSRIQLENELGIKFKKKALLVTFHPVTLENNTAVTQMSELLKALETLDDTTLIFTMPNADTGGLAQMKLIQEFVKRHRHSIVCQSLGRVKYLSCLQFVDGVVGNSSSGLIEAPSFKIGTINIGDRQSGRIKAESVIDCEPISASIQAALINMYEENFQNRLKSLHNPFGNGGASNEIIRILKQIDLLQILKKEFHDL
jgi:GDP/UDP-N,N'-diacetylbacillosamine 2-epimerase (hydrolysing)